MEGDAHRASRQLLSLYDIRDVECKRIMKAACALGPESPGSFEVRVDLQTIFPPHLVPDLYAPFELLSTHLR